MPLTDTSPAAKELQLRIELAMTGEQRILQALEASLLVRELSESGVRMNHPLWTEGEIAREVLRLQFLPAQLPPGF
jgi:hypothetical protein